MDKIKKNEKAKYAGILYSEKEYEKLKKDILILDEIEKIARKNNGTFFVDKNT